jgi:pSer/pThr/pTyr-binding forkhead associated (FHA) protein
MWILETDEHAEDAVTFRLASGTIRTVGRTTLADFVLDRALVSRIHCRLTADGDTLAVEDLSSTNGTFVNGKRIARAMLASGDRLCLGRVELTIKNLEGES